MNPETGAAAGENRAQKTLNRVVIATKNQGKKRELAAILADLVGDVEVLSATDTHLSDVVEDGTTFAQNALLKARSAVQETGLPAIADDSGLIVDILGAAPGILSARWAGHHGDDQANLELLLAQLADVPPHNRGARFECAAAFVTPQGVEIVAHGIMAGRLLSVARGTNGFGYDPIFVPQGYDRTTAEMDVAEKNTISHRAQALTNLARQIRQYFA